MPDLDDSGLLRRYAEEHSDEAFAGLVRRHVNLVYSVALRQTRDPNNAEEITQAVFIILAKKAKGLRHARALSSWLFQTTRLTAANFVRSDLRRRQREQEAYMQSTVNESGGEVWTRIAPLLDNAVEHLREKDRQAVTLRFYQGHDLREVGMAMGASEEAAKKRVNRALEKLRTFFKRRGVIVSLTSIAGAIATNSVQAAPVTLAKAATAAALSKGAVASGSTLVLAKGALKIMAWTKAQTTAATVLILGLGAYSLFQHQTGSNLRQAEESLRQQVARLGAENDRLLARQREQKPRLPAPQFQPTADATPLPVQTAGPTNLYARLLDKEIKLTSGQLEPFLKATGRNATTLLAAFRTSGDRALLQEAMQKYPNDPNVAFEASFDKELSPEEKRQWLNNFEKAAPNNAMANYLSALNYFRTGQTDQAVQELTAAHGKGFEDYTVSRVEDDVEAYLSAGYTVADAKVLASSQLLLPQLAQMKQLSQSMFQVADAYTQAGDAASAQAVLQTAQGLGQRYSAQSPGEPEVSALVGIWIERKALQGMDPNSPYGDRGQTVQDRLNELTQLNTSLRSLGEQASNLYPNLTEQDWIIYKDRWMMFGEANAQQWVLNKYGQK
jgi:RNA polymerase sigma factor (sigma-70 family)